METLLSRLIDLNKEFFFLTRQDCSHPIILGLKKASLNLSAEDDDDQLNKLYKLELEIEIDPDDDDVEQLDSEKFQYFKYLEAMVCRTLSEVHNDDACSVSFGFDTNHMQGPVRIFAQITDYLT